jgi:hypothetical protein
VEYQHTNQRLHSLRFSFVLHMSLGNLCMSLGGTLLFGETSVWKTATDKADLIYFITYFLCGLLVRVPGYRSRGPGSRVWNGVHSAS